jgi:hypothetical protein
MPAIGIGVVWFGYSMTLWGYCLIRGYNVKLTDLINPLHPYAGKWPPPLITNGSEVLPGQTVTGQTGSSQPPAATGLLGQLGAVQAGTSAGIQDLTGL